MSYLTSLEDRELIYRELTHMVIGEGIVRTPSGLMRMKVPMTDERVKRDILHRELAERDAESFFNSLRIELDEDPEFFLLLTDYYFNLRKETHVHREGGGQPPSLKPEPFV